MKPSTFTLVGREREFTLYWGRYYVGRIWSRRPDAWFVETFDRTALDGTTQRWRRIFLTLALAQAELEARVTRAAATGAYAPLASLEPIDDQLLFPLIIDAIRKAAGWRCTVGRWPRCLFPGRCTCISQAEAIGRLLSGRPDG
jgi:hypothetical protein